MAHRRCGGVGGLVGSVDLAAFPRRPLQAVHHGAPLDAALLEDIVRAQPNLRFDRCHLKTLGESSLLFELSFFVMQPKLNPLRDLQQTVNLRIIDAK